MLQWYNYSVPYSNNLSYWGDLSWVHLYHTCTLYVLHNWHSLAQPKCQQMITKPTNAPLSRKMSSEGISKSGVLEKRVPVAISMKREKHWKQESLLEASIAQNYKEIADDDEDLFLNSNENKKHLANPDTHQRKSINWLVGHQKGYYSHLPS